jgi:hypothetical protein
MTELEELQRRIELKKQLIDLTREELNYLLNKKGLLEIEALDGKEEK